MVDEKEIKQEENAQKKAEQMPSSPADVQTVQLSAAAKKRKRKKRLRIIRNIIIFLVVAAMIGAIVFGSIKFLSDSEEEGEIMHAYVTIGSIVSTVSGEGLTRAKESASLTMTTSGIVREVLVKEGEQVEAGQQLYRIESESAEAAVAAAEREVERCERELAKLRDAENSLVVTAPHGGKLREVADIRVGERLETGAAVASLVDDSRMTLRQYFSYAYENEIKEGQSAEISIPAQMTTVRGIVTEIYMVERIGEEGSKLFEVNFLVDNPGTLTAGVKATAVLENEGELIYPYEAGELDYFRTTRIVTKAGGPVQQIRMREYAAVEEGETLVVMGNEDNDSAIFNMEEQLKTEQKKLEEARHTLELLDGISPISGTVMSVSIAPGQEVATGATVVTVSDYSTILMDANVDERNISYVKEGMMVDVNQWGTMCMGVITSVSMTSDVNNGVATFPAVISIDNSEGLLMPGGYATYSLVASQSDACMVLPIQAVKSVETADGSQSVVFVHADVPPENVIELEFPVEGVPEEGYYPVPVTIGIADAQNVEITSGVEEGMEVFQQVMYNGMW